MSSVYLHSLASYIGGANRRCQESLQGVAGGGAGRHRIVLEVVVGVLVYVLVVDD